MLNSEKYKTAEERARAFDKWCRSNCCEDCILRENGIELSTCVCSFYWLDMEAEEEKLLPCPYCGGTDVVIQDVGGFEIACQGCGFHTPSYMVLEKLISEYQRVARAAAAGKKEVTT